MNKFWIIFWHTYLSKLKTKSFLITTGITLLLIFGLTNLQNVIEFFNNGDKEATKVAVIDQTADKSLYPVFEQNASALDEKLQLKRAEKSEEQLKKDVLDEKMEGYLILSLDQNGLPQGSFFARSIANSSVSETMEQALQQTKIAAGTANLGLNSEQLNQLFAPSELKKTALLENAKSEEELDQARGLVYVLLFIIYFSVILYASMIAMEVAVEKSSRVMEILISSVSPIKQMFAKLLGIGLLSITQFGLIILVGYSSMKRNMENADLMGDGFFNFSEVPVATLIYAIVFFILGYFIFATLAAFLGSLVSRIEDVQQMISPMTYIIVGAFIIAMFGLGNPEAPFITVTSFIPLFSPMIMFLRVGMLSVPAWEIGLSIGILVITIIALAVLGAKVYKGGVLMYGKSSSFKDVKKALQMSKDQ
ncbi:ABC transporter permease [Metabacillus dongyingensis]|uniref:ABC transporter permease n=1 Tax=Metabacillus dongyingensis TaxID=2874282 RepID=UPI001CBFC41F|nr:ABC transporter permease [Metabacillus dongyingensis]UAL53155.1 ABC transporter permease [Metabacillus dongyingensis]